MNDNISMLQVQDVHKSYRMGQAKLAVLRGVNLAVNKGEFIAIVGASGSGKSTFLHILGALDKPDKGTIKFGRQELGRAGQRWLSRFRNKTVGFVFQFYHLLDELNVVENVLLPKMAGSSVAGWLVSRGAAKKRARELLDRFGLAERLRHKPYQLSGGERQRVAIARALMNEPEVLLADEPTGNLDSETGNGILEVLSELNRAGQTVVMVTHDDRIADRAGRVIQLIDGVITEQGGS